MLLEFSGGAELLFGNQRQQEVTLSCEKEWKVEDLLVWIKVCQFVNSTKTCLFHKQSVLV